MKKVKALSEKLKASICHNCPLCRHARSHPESFIGKIVHGKHAKDCPMWKAEEEVFGKEG